MKRIGMVGFLLGWFIGGLFSAQCFAYEVQPQRIAILPVINREIHDEQVEKMVCDALTAKFYMPLRTVVTIFEIVPADQVVVALPAEFYHARKPMRLRAISFPDIASKLQADMVIGAEITELTATTLNTFEGDLIQKTNVSIQIIAYEARDNKYTKVNDFERYEGDWSVRGDATYLTKEIMNRLLEKIVLAPKK